MTEFLDFFATNPNIFIIIIGITSLFIGSFLNVVIYRLPRIMERNWNEECRQYLGLKPQKETEKLNLCLPSSHCPRCKKAIHPWHNIPIISFAWLKGKCANCKTRIPIQYPLVEAFTCLLSIYVAWQFGFSLQTLAGLLFTWIAISLTYIDIEHHLLPDQLTLLLVWLGLFFSLFNVFVDSETAIIGAIIGYLTFALVQSLFGFFTGKIGMGQGDYKFLAGFGAFLGWQLLPFIILFASIVGIIFTISHMFIKRQFKSVPFPFGPYLAIAGWIALMHGNAIMQFYLGMM